jgi:uncharacterized protein Yka (UPF0111/DUF47 family)
MSAKSAVLGTLDERGLLLPELLERAFAANERAKYELSLLQMAVMHATAPDVDFPNLRGERLAAGVTDERFDTVVATARPAREDQVRVPMGAEIVEDLLEDVGRMVDPLRVAERAGGLEGRLAAIVEAAPRGRDVFRPFEIEALASADRSSKDSLHVLVMDAHRALDALASEVAVRDIGGARTHGLGAEDEELVVAFMQGVAETERLRFGHPGLGTIASKVAGRLVLQNDIGQTDAHVVVIHVDGLEARVTYTDVHIARLEFFQRMLDRHEVAWEDTRTRRASGLAGGESFFLAAGVHRAPGRKELAEYLRFLGSRIVFLIDWNRARRQLRSFVPKAESLALLDEAAAGGYGQRGFLEMGGERLVFDAMASVMRTPFRFGERLHDMLGTEQAVAYLRFTLRVTAEGLLAGVNRPLLREQVNAELVRYFHGGGERFLDLVAEHARLTRALAALFRDALQGGASDGRARKAELAKEREAQADALVVESRALAERMPGMAPLRRVVDVADDAADGLEEAAFHLSLFTGPEETSSALENLAALCEQACDAYLRALEGAKRLVVGAERATVNDFLAAVDRVVALEHETDEAERHVVADALRAEGNDARRIFVVSSVASDLEKAADSLMHAALALRDHVLSEVMAP